MSVTVRDLRKEFGGRTVLDLPALDVTTGEFFVLLGPSGSGKTTLLRSLAGLVRPDVGVVQLDGQDMAEVAPHERSIGFVFQGLALWPHMSVRGNLALGLDRFVPDAAQRCARIEEIAAELGIARFLASKPAALSGGERQRVALARALVRRPRLLLLDEPFSDLDARLRREVARLVRRLHDSLGMTTILITHDRTDAHLLADRIGVLRAGKLVACGAPDALHADPRDSFVATFLTDAALLRGAAAGDRVATALGELPLATPATGAVRVVVRPDELRLVAADGVGGEVVASEFAGGPWRHRIAIGDEELHALSSRCLAPGTAVQVAPPASPRRVVEDA